MSLTLLRRCSPFSSNLLRPGDTLRRFASSTSHRHGEYMLGDHENYTPRRALLYVPMHSDKMVAKVNEMNADCVVLELEDGVALTSKEIARRNVVQWLNENKGRSSNPNCREIGVRVNDLHSGAIDYDLAAVSRAIHQPQAFMIPKVHSVYDIHNLQATFERHYGKERLGEMIKNETRFVGWIETGQALLNMPAIIECAAAMYHQREFFKLDALVFGSDDYCADIEARRSSSGIETLFARQSFVMNAKTFGVQAIDSVYIDMADEAGLERQCEEGSSWGFTGKQVIHPKQVDIVQKGFSPPPERVKWAKELVEAFAAHQEAGRGAFTFHGNMIDRPLLQQAKNVLKYVH